MPPSPSTTSASRRRYGSEKPVVLTQEPISEAVSREAPLRSKSRCKTQATLTLLWRFPTSAAMNAIVICQKGLPLCHERFAVEPASDYTRLLEALHRA